VLKHFCEVVVNVFPLPNENYYYLVLVSVYLVNGAVISYSQTPKIRQLQLLSNFLRIASKLFQRFFYSRLSVRIKFLQCLRSLRVQKHLERQKLNFL
jgi:hypothetical protein